MDSNQLKNQIEQVANLSISSDDGNDKNRSAKIISCTYCALNFRSRSDLRQHCQTEAHQTVIMSDEGRDWKCRPPPRGFTADSYTLCENFMENASCHYGHQCVEAHGNDELHEWQERFEYRKMRMQRACEKELFGKSFTEQLLEKWMSAPSPDRIMKEKVDGIDETVSNELVTTVSSKVSKREWTFVLKTKRMLKAVALLQDAHRNHFLLKQVFPAEPRPVKRGQTYNNKVVEAELLSDQEWVAPNIDERYLETPTERSPMLEHRVKVVFSTDIYGTFRQSVVFDFGTEPVLVKHFCVDVIPITEADKIQDIKKEMVVSSSQRWDETNVHITFYSPPLLVQQQQPLLTSKLDVEREKELLSRYPCPRAPTFTLTQSTIMEKKITKNNYRSRMHELLYIEEIARYDQVARYNLTTKLQLDITYDSAPNGIATNTAKYSYPGELYAVLTLSKDVSEDTSAGRLILNNCTTVYISDAGAVIGENERRKVYEALIEDKGKSIIYLKLSTDCVSDLKLTAKTEFLADIQFQLNRLTYCEWHHAIDKLVDYKLIFPETFMEPSIPWTPKTQWSENLDEKLNPKQKEAVLAITAISNVGLPPILLIGPFGTGKTFTLASSIKQLLLQPDARILICTHSNSAADLYIKDYLHPWVEGGLTDATPLRVYYHKRWVATVNSIVQKYCLIDSDGITRVFRRPSKEDVMQHRIVVVTLNISMELASLDLPKGHFTHILLDEAAQAMECEAIMPLALADDNTRIVLAGEHMQMSPELVSNFAKERRLHVSLLERLYDHYPVDFPCKVLLCENYRAHEAIIKFTSELFYDQKLIASGKQPRHDKYFPLTFFTTRGEDVQDNNSTAFYNNSEVYEVVERVVDSRKQWPASWGKLNDHSIGIMTPYADQVFRIRSELRKRKMGGISVERVLNVQGKQFRAIFLSTVRTRRTLPSSGNLNSSSQTEDMDYGFLSNSKLLNTAITRAQSLVAVVGDPVALCSVGRCRKVWERFIEMCNLNKSLFGITWSLLRSQLDGVELKKAFVLNPLAPEFVPRALQAETYLREQQMHAQQQQVYPYVSPPHMPSYVGYSTHSMINQPMRMESETNMQHNYKHRYGSVPAQPPVPTKSVAKHPPFFYQNQHHQILRNQTMPGLNYTANNQQNFWAPTLNSNQNVWPKAAQGIRPENTNFSRTPHQQQPPPPQPQQPPLNMNMPMIPRQQSSTGTQHMHHNTIPYMPNNKQQSPGMYGANVQNHLRNVNVANPATLTTPNAQPHVQQDMNTSPLTSDIMASITQRANQLHQQNLFKSTPMQQLQPQQQVPANNKFPFFMDNKSHHTVDPQQMLQHQQPLPNMNQHHLSAQKSQHVALMNQNQQKMHQVHQQPSITPNIPDFTHLLPPNMSFYDMASEPKENQFKWYVKLNETHGSDAANKYAEIMTQMYIMSKPAMAMNMPPIPNVDLMFENIVNSPVTNLSNLLGKKDHLPNDSFAAMGGNVLALANRNGGEHGTMPSINDLINAHQSELGMQAKNILPKPQPQQQQQQQQPPQSVPLYQRQAAGNFNVQPNNMPMSLNATGNDISDHNLFENLFNHNGMPQSLTPNDLLGNPQHFQGLPPLQSFVNPGNSISNSVQMAQSMHSGANQNILSLNHMAHHNANELNKRSEDEHHRPNATTTYASVLSQGAINQQSNQNLALNKQSKNEEKDPFAAIRELGQRSNGLYNYFQ